MEEFFAPDVLECTHFVYPSSGRNQRTVRDYEFDYYCGGKRDIFIDGVPYRIREGCLVFRKPGETVVGYGDYDMYLLTLDFSHRVLARTKHYYRSSDTPTQSRCAPSVLEELPSVFVPYHRAELTELYQRLIRCSLRGFEDRSRQRALVEEFLFLVLADARRYCRLQEEPSETNPYVKEACAYIHEHYREPLQVRELAARLFIHPNHLIRLFRQELQLTPGQYLLETRLLCARSLLVHSDAPVGQVGEECGFNTPSYFISCFQKRFGKTPHAYRRSLP